MDLSTVMVLPWSDPLQDMHFCCWIFFFFVVLGFELRALYFLSKCSTT
jgi:hypothetical protein